MSFLVRWSFAHTDAGALSSGHTGHVGQIGHTGHVEQGAHSLRSSQVLAFGGYNCRHSSAVGRHRRLHLMSLTVRAGGREGEDTEAD